MKFSRRPGLTVRALSLVAVLAALGLTGCGVSPSENGPQAEPLPTFAGVNADAADHSIALRSLYIVDPGAEGYQSGAKAPLSVTVWNNTNAPVNLTGATLDKKPLELVGTGETAVTTFEVLVPPGGNVPLTQAEGRYLQIACMPGTVPSGAVLPLTFTFDNKVEVKADVPVGAAPVDGKAAATTGASAC